MEDIKKVFGRNVRKYRERMEWSQAELAEKIDISTAFMTYIEHGKRGASMETIEILAITFGIPYAALFEDDSGAGFSEGVWLKLQRLKKQLILSMSQTIDEFLAE